MPTDAFSLQRFENAQSAVWPDVLAELKAGHKRTHWMWFVFPQLAVLGRSAMALHYGLSGLDEALALLAHPLLGPRLKEVAAVLLALPSHDAVQIFGEVDAMKLRSSLTMFAAASGEPGDVFHDCLQRFFGGEADPLTLAHLK